MHAYTAWHDNPEMQLEMHKVFIKTVIICIYVLR